MKYNLGAANTGRILSEETKRLRRKEWERVALEEARLKLNHVVELLETALIRYEKENHETKKDV